MNHDAHMISDLLDRPTPKRPETLRFEGRVLYLVDDSALMEAQLAHGEELALTPDLKSKLRDQISTDEITPAYICLFYDETLGDFPYLGLAATNPETGIVESPVERIAVKHGGFVCSVAGKRRGKGSSREASPYAELKASIRIVVAESHERIYNENCQNLGVLTTTDFDVIRRIEKGEDIPLAIFTEGQDEITRQIIEYGGLFEFNVARLQGKVTLPAPACEDDGATASTPMTLAEKIFAKHRVVDAARGEIGVPWIEPGEAGFFPHRRPFFPTSTSHPCRPSSSREKVGKTAEVVDPSSVLFFRDHLTFLSKVMSQERIEQGLLDVANELEIKQREFAVRQGIRLYGEQMGRELGSEAICHSKILEEYAEPRMLIIGSDSHTPHAGAIGCVAFGVGTTAIFNSWITKDVRVQVPRSFKVVISGEPRVNVTAKDYMLEILRNPYIRDGHAIGQVIEYAGPAVEALSVDEAGDHDEHGRRGRSVHRHRRRGRQDRRVPRERPWNGPRAAAGALVQGMQSDPDASYVKIIEVDTSTIEPMAALPGDPGNGVLISDLAADPIRIDIAYAGSCTAGRKEDMDMYARVFREAQDAGGLTVHPDAECFIQCGSIEVREYCREKGYLELFERVGASFIEPGCGACINAGPGVTRSQAEVSVSSQNRNFPGRSGPGQLYLVSPYSVAASTIAGYVTQWEPGKAIEPIAPRKLTVV